MNFHGGGDGPGYTPIANSDGSVVGARPEFYGILPFTLAGQGTLYTTQISAGSLTVTAYAVKTFSGGSTLSSLTRISPRIFSSRRNFRRAPTPPRGAKRRKLNPQTAITS